MSGRFVKGSLLTLATLAGLFAGSAAWIALTENGTRFLLRGIATHLPMLELGSVSGTLGHLQVQNFRWTSEGLSLSADEVALQLNLPRFALLSLDIEKASVNGFRLDLSDGRTHERTETSSTERLSLGFDIRVRDLLLHNATLGLSESALSLDSLQGSYSWIDDKMSVQGLRIKHLAVLLPPDESDPDSLTAATIHEKLSNLTDRPLIDLTSIGNDGPLNFDLHLDNLHADALTVARADTPDQALLALGDLSLTGALDKAVLSLQEARVQHLTWGKEPGLHSLGLSGRMMMKEAWPLHFKARFSASDSGWAVRSGKVDLQGDLAKSVRFTASTEGDLAGELVLDWSPALKGLPGEMTLTLLSPYVTDPEASPTERLILEQGTLNLKGDVARWSLSGLANLRQGKKSNAILSVEGAGRPEGAALKDLRLTSASGTAFFKGDVTWTDILRWRGLASVENLDLTDFSSLPGEALTGTARVVGRYENPHRWQAEIPAFSLDGRWQEKPLHSEGSLLVRDTYRLYAPKITLRLGDNTAAFLAKFDRPVFEADLKIDAPNLEDFDPRLRGTVKGSILLRGDPAHPVFVANLKGNRLGFMDTDLREMTLGGTLKPDLKGTVGGKIALVAKGLTDRRMPQLSTKVAALVLEGNEKKHTLKFGLQGEPYAAGFRLQGAFNRQTFDWNGLLAAARLTTPTGLWSQEQKTNMAWKHDRRTLTVGSHDWTHPDARVRVETFRIGPSGELSFDLKRLGLTIFDPYLPKGSRLTGALLGHAKINWSSGEKLEPRILVSASSEDLALHREMERSDGGDTVRITLPFRHLALNARLDNDTAAVDWDGDFRRGPETDASGHFDGYLRVEDPTEQRRLTGEATIEELNMSFLNSFFQTGERAEGTASSQLQFGGTLRRPEASGFLTLKGLRIHDGMTPVDMNPSDFALRFEGTASTLTGTFKTRHGQVALTGLADWNDPQKPTAEIRAAGDNLELTLPPYAQLRVTPDIFARAETDKIILGGLIEVPFAKIVVNEMPPSTVGVSRDEVMLTEDLKPIRPKSARIPIESDLRIRLGNKVKLEAFGLKTKITGEVEVMQNKRGLGLNGQLNLKNGRFKAYGQDLTVENGQIIFAGPVDRPTLDVAAIRNPEKTEDDVTAGIRVTGTADAPKIEVFSRPSMPRPEALAYLIRGHGLDDTDENNDNALLTSALIGIGLSQTGNVIGSIGEAFGIRDFGVDTAGTGENSQVVVSGYLLPRLQVKYGVGLFDSLSTLTLRYRLMPKLFLESVSGVNQSMDLLYKFEF